MTFPYGPPSEATYAQCDPLIVDLVRKINADGRVQTVQSCEGHPWPMLELAGSVPHLAEVAAVLAQALPEKYQLVVVNVVAGERWRFTVIPPHQEPGAITIARDVLGAPWPGERENLAWVLAGG